MNLIDGLLHNKIISYVVAEHEHSSDRAIGRLLTVLKQGNTKLGESDFWLLVEMVSRKLMDLHQNEDIAPELIQTTTYEVLTCIVERAKEVGVTGMGQRKLMLFLKEMSGVRHAMLQPLYDPFDDDVGDVRDGDPLAQLSDEVRTAIAQCIKESEKTAKTGRHTSRGNPLSKKRFSFWPQT